MEGDENNLIWIPAGEVSEGNGGKRIRECNFTL